MSGVGGRRLVLFRWRNNRDGKILQISNSWLVPIRVFSLAHTPLEAWAKPRPLGCVTIRQNRHSGRAQRFWARPGIQENRGNQIILDLPPTSAGDDELRRSPIGQRMNVAGLRGKQEVSRCCRPENPAFLMRFRGIVAHHDEKNFAGMEWR